MPLNSGMTWTYVAGNVERKGIFLNDLIRFVLPQFPLVTTSLAFLTFNQHVSKMATGFPGFCHRIETSIQNLSGKDYYIGKQDWNVFYTNFPWVNLSQIKF